MQQHVPDGRRAVPVCSSIGQRSTNYNRGPELARKVQIESTVMSAYGFCPGLHCAGSCLEHRVFLFLNCFHGCSAGIMVFCPCALCVRY
jgi:hypothetical protein